MQFKKITIAALLTEYFFAYSNMGCMPPPPPPPEYPIWCTKRKLALLFLRCGFCLSFEISGNRPIYDFLIKTSLKNCWQLLNEFSMLKTYFINRAFLMSLFNHLLETYFVLKIFYGEKI